MEISMSVYGRPRQAGGFSLIELMVTVAVAATIFTIAIPTYQAQVRKSRRTEARTAVMDLATREERYFSVNNAYSSSALQLGYGAQDAAITAQPVGNNGYYQVTVQNTPAVPPARAGFTIIATAVGSQLKDTPCQQFQVNEAGTQTSTPSATECWN
jgi:type IV pilus assembly protein PilE